jgi:hypothetical protein
MPPSHPDTMNTATATKQAEPTENILENSKFLAANPKYVPTIRHLIEVAGFKCPAITSLRYRGISPYGYKLEALCGPDDGSGNTYTVLHYAVYPEKLKVNLCKEFGLFSGDCS